MAVITALIIVSGLLAHRSCPDDSVKLGEEHRNQDSIRAEKWDSASDALDRIRNDWTAIKKNMVRTYRP